LGLANESLRQNNWISYEKASVSKHMENTHVYLDTSTESEATISEHPLLTIRAHEAELGNMLGQVTLDAQETWILKNV
jgi:hypothetical protein